jgi:hypothetical protein
MHTLRAIRPLRLFRHRQSFIWTTNRTLHSFLSQPTPWFVDPEEEHSTLASRPAPPHLPETPYELPAGIPEPIKVLYNELSASPYLEPSTLVARKPLQIPLGPPLPERKPKGRRRIRGKTFAGESLLDTSGGIWNWVVMAQVCQLDMPQRMLCIKFAWVCSRLRRVQKIEDRSSRSYVSSVRQCVAILFCSL